MFHDILFFEVTFTKWTQKRHITTINMSFYPLFEHRGMRELPWQVLMVFEFDIVKRSGAPCQNTIDDISHLLFADARPGGIFRRLIGKSPDPRKSPAPSFLGSWDWERCMKSQVFLRSRVISDHLFCYSYHCHSCPNEPVICGNSRPWQRKVCVCVCVTRCRIYLLFCHLRFSF